MLKKNRGTNILFCRYGKAKQSPKPLQGAVSNPVLYIWESLPAPSPLPCETDSSFSFCLVRDEREPLLVTAQSFDQAPTTIRDE